MYTWDVLFVHPSYIFTYHSTRGAVLAINGSNGCETLGYEVWVFMKSKTTNRMRQGEPKRSYDMESVFNGNFGHWFISFNNSYYTN